MKRLTLLKTLPILFVASLASCGGGSHGGGLAPKSGDKIYYERILFDTSDETASNPSIYLEAKDGVKEVKVGREVIKFGYSGGVLTLDAAALRNAGPKELTASVTMGNGKKTSIDIFNATKFIKTAEDFQAIGSSKKACEGYYVLANDIDCSSISNFEPIGQYFSEEDPDNFYFHGVLDGDGYAIKNVTCTYSHSPVGISGGGYASNYDVYSGSFGFTNDAHKAGDNIGIFQVIGSSGLVRNVTFDNCNVHGRTIVGIIAGNNMGHVYDCLIKENCQVKMDTHFYDDDCNTGAAFGIVAGSGEAKNLISLTTRVSMLDIYEDYDDVYKGKTGNNWDHSATEGNTDPWWRFASATKEIPGTSTKITDSNNQKSNGIYSVVGKCWGQVQDSVGAAFSFTPINETAINAAFGHTHQGINKPTSGDSDLGSITNCAVYSASALKQVSTYSAYNFSSEIWNIQEGSFPALKENINRFDIAK